MDIVQTAVVLAFGLALASKFDELISERPDFKKVMVSTIINFPNAKYSDIIKKSNEIFLKLFGLIYENNSDNKILWSWISSSFSILFLFGLLFQIYQITVPLENLLLYNILLTSFLFFLTIVFVKFDIKLISYSKTKKAIIRIILFVLIIVMFVFLFEKTFRIIYNISEITDIREMSFIIPFGIFIGVYFVNFLYERKSVLLEKSPIRVIITSFLAIIVITLLKKDILASFITDYNEIGIILLAYLFLNIFADSISLLETDIVLRLAAKGNIKRFAALGLFDIFLSAVIFLAIPLSTGNLDVFLDAIWFKGEHPWLGVLFWSTFSTSIIFWLFLLSVFVLTFLQKILKYYVKLNVVLPIDKKPITCLYVTAVVFIMPFMFVVI